MTRRQQEARRVTEAILDGSFFIGIISDPSKCMIKFSDEFYNLRAVVMHMKEEYTVPARYIPKGQYNKEHKIEVKEYPDRRYNLRDGWITMSRPFKYSLSSIGVLISFPAWIIDIKLLETKGEYKRVSTFEVYAKSGDDVFEYYAKKKD